VLWNIERREAVARSAELGRIRQLAFTAGGSHLICVRQVETADAGTASCEISLVNLPGLTIHSKVGNCPDPISVMRCSPDGRHVAAIAGGYVVVWNLKTGRRRELRAWKATPAPPPGKSEGGYPRCLAFSPLGRTLAVSADDRTLTLFNASDGKRLESLPTDTAFAALAFSPDLRLLAAGPAEVAAEFGDRAVGPWVKSVEFWNLQTKRQVVLGIQHESTNLLPAFTTGGVRLVTAGHKTLKLWDMTWWPTQDTKLLDTVDAHRGDIWLLQAAQNQDVLMSCGEKAIKLWRVGER
jgi:WD40 repeat protein